MRLFTTVVGLQSYVQQAKLKGDSIGLVPTMGALHLGHLSLVERARQENSLVVVSIFVNPLQFGPNEDFKRYPRTLEDDRQLCEQAGVDVIFAPTPEEMGVSQTGSPNLEGLLTQVIPPVSMTSVLCGRSRPGHFQGVATIVTKLLNLVQPERAYFGQKDAQQLAILQQVVKDLDVPVTLVPCPIIREASGLAYSSRNQYLSTEHQTIAPALYRSLNHAAQLFKAGERSASVMIASVKQQLSNQPAIEIEYVELVHPQTLMPLETIEEVGMLALAARIGSTRLIDNILLHNRQPIVAIDGPAGAGKSTVTRLVAEQLGLLYLDTGAMYRAVTWLVMQSKIPLTDEPAIAELVSRCEIRFVSGTEALGANQIYINGENVTQIIRSLEVTAQVSAVSALASVRSHLVKQQQAMGKKGGLVAEGRDIGTQVFPDAELKIFLTASVNERAKRRLIDLETSSQQTITFEQLEADIAQRDYQDSTRKISPLRKAPDAIEIITDGLTVSQVINRIVDCYKAVIISNQP